MKNIFKLIAVAVACVPALTGCSEKFIQRDRPLVMTENLIYSNATYIESALLGCYSSFKSSSPSLMAGRAYVVFDSRGEDIVNMSNPVTLQDTYEMKVLPTTQENSQIWDLAYSTINNCNIFIDNLAKYNCKSVIGEAKCNQFEAEAKFLRAYCYYVLVNLYSQPYKLDANAPAVPLRLTGLVSSGNNDCPRSSISAIYAQMLADCIPAALADAPNTRDGVTRASKAAAHMLRMRVYMAQEDWDNAIAEGEAIAGYEIAADVTELYGTDTYNSKEMIFALPMSNQDKPNTQQSCAEFFCKDASVCFLDFEKGILSEANYSLADDDRIKNLISEADGNGHKFSKKFVDQGQKQDWVPLMRFSETELSLAECYVNKADAASLTAAKNHLKAVRNKRIPASDPLNIDAMDSAELTTAIQKERRLEFICEGMRGIDIMRRGENFVKNNSFINIRVTPTDSYYTWPIPDTEKAYNKAL